MYSYHTTLHDIHWISFGNTHKVHPSKSRARISVIITVKLHAICPNLILDDTCNSCSVEHKND